MALLSLMACSGVTVTPFQDAAGNPCQTVKVKADWYTSETSTSCVRDGKAVEIATNHTDLTMVAALGGIIAALIGLH